RNLAAPPFIFLNKKRAGVSSRETKGACRRPIVPSRGRGANDAAYSEDPACSYGVGRWIGPLSCRLVASQILIAIALTSFLSARITQSPSAGGKKLKKK